TATSGGSAISFPYAHGQTANFTLYAQWTAALSCAAGGACVVGDTGPGGGIVFYVAGATFTSTGSDCATACRYLEAAPTDQSTGVAWAYTNNGKSDWHLPSRNELNELRQQAASVGGFAATEYWSSSEYVDRYYASAQAFLGQAQFIQVKSVATFRVRPVRAFG
ncbi:MAG: DUF1566 domain-containing protein, partial [Actinobacteria bacterium]|nr:DUF1566 domain-containing protein [Actinomycetota bacterium]